ncbi:hypothetical protein NUW58_g1577 [Xylaria curta]|uniref:Uncharacterized protein n=1 Tax=Xylaria curta TaxID=42375 RepID=A0ACC1PMG8_9PEZI|nr:hypothetical protein NUW58_g1577 [Xylaria curta]
MKIFFVRQNETAAKPISQRMTRLPTQVPSPLPSRAKSEETINWSLGGLKRCVHKTWWPVGKHWLPETASLVFAISIFVAVVVLLATRRDKPQPDWPSLLNINALLSILTTLLRVSILFPVAEAITELKWIWFANVHPLRDIDHYEAAGRSPWGALKLLCRRPSDILTSFGAAIIVVTLAIDAFSQQVLNFYSCPQPVTGMSASIARTNNYTVGGFSFGVGMSEPDVKIAAALYEGLLNPPANASSINPTVCPSGNCTFTGMYSSLEMCSSVQDISDQITQRGDFDPMNNWNYFLPSGVYIGGGHVLTTAPIDGDRNKFREDRPMFSMEVLMVGLDCNTTSKDTPPDKADCLPHPKAFHVALSPCIRTYSDASHLNAIFNERVVSTDNLAAIQLRSTGRTEYYSLAGDFPSYPGVDCIPSDSPRGSKTQPTSLLTNGLRHAKHAYNASEDPDTLYIDRKCIYEVGFAAASALSSSLTTVFFGKPFNRPNNVTTPRGISSPANGDEWLKTLWAEGTADIANVTSYMDGLSRTVSRAIRLEGDTSNSAPFAGTVMGSETCIGVNWPWLALPASLLFFSIVFVLLAIVRSGRYTSPGSLQSGRKPWKSSTLPLMWCGVEDQTRYKFPGFTEIKDMETSADEVKVRLRRVAGGTNERGQTNELGFRGRWILQQEIVNNGHQ